MQLGQRYELKTHIFDFVGGCSALVWGSAREDDFGAPGCQVVRSPISKTTVGARHQDCMTSHKCTCCVIQAQIQESHIRIDSFFSSFIHKQELTSGYSCVLGLKKIQRTKIHEWTAERTCICLSCLPIIAFIPLTFEIRHFLESKIPRFVFVVSWQHTFKVSASRTVEVILEIKYWLKDSRKDETQEHSKIGE